MIFPTTLGAVNQVLTLDSNGNIVWANTGYDANLSGVNAANARTSLGLVIGSNIQAYDANTVTAGNTVTNLIVTGGSITSTPISGSSGNFSSLIVNGMIYPTVAGSANQVLTLDNSGNLIWANTGYDADLSGINAANVRSNLGLIIGSTVQAFDPNTVTAGNAVNNLIMTGGNISGSSADLTTLSVAGVDYLSTAGIEGQILQMVSGNLVLPRYPLA